MDVRRLKLTIAYDGSNYAGFQWQPNDIGVQQRLEEALQKLYPSVKRIHGSSRTDTGVHARGMVAHVDVPHTRKEMTPSKLRLALNANLPEDVRISLIQRVASDFHARFDAKGKQYRYFIWNHAAMDPPESSSATVMTARTRAETRSSNGKSDGASNVKQDEVFSSSK